MPSGSKIRSRQERLQRLARTRARSGRRARSSPCCTSTARPAGASAAASRAGASTRPARAASCGSGGPKPRCRARIARAGSGTRLAGRSIDPEAHAKRQQVAHRDRAVRRARCRRADRRGASAPGDPPAPAAAGRPGRRAGASHSSTRIIAATAVDRLRHRRDAEDRVTSHRMAAADCRRPDGVDVHRTAPAEDRHQAGQLAAIHVGLHHLVHAIEARPRQSSRARSYRLLRGRDRGLHELVDLGAALRRRVSPRPSPAPARARAAPRRARDTRPPGRRPAASRG